MTIVVGVAAPDGMILAADSRITLTWDNGRHRIASDSGQKIFAIREQVGIATYGDAYIGKRTIAGVMDEFVAQLGSDQQSVDAFAAQLGDFFHGRFLSDSLQPMLEWCKQNPKRSRFGFVVAGYDSGGIGRLYDVMIPGPQVAPVVAVGEITTADLGVCWRGQTDVIRRLIKGFDGDLFATAGHKVPAELQQPVASLEYSLLLPITMQDAVDLATFLIRTTIDMQRFSDGTVADPGSVPGCGGHVRVLSIVRDHAEWIAADVLSADGSAGVAEGGRSAP